MVRARRKREGEEREKKCSPSMGSPAVEGSSCPKRRFRTMASKMTANVLGLRRRASKHPSSLAFDQQGIRL
jgi:hypothetical protein